MISLLLVGYFIIGVFVLFCVGLSMFIAYLIYKVILEGLPGWVILIAITIITWIGWVMMNSLFGE